MSDTGAADLSKLTDEDLRRLYGANPSAPEVSAISDDDLKRLYAQQQAGGGQFSHMTDTAARWATAGLSDLAAAAGAATGQYLGSQPGSWSENYNKALARERGEAQAFGQQHPYENAAAGGAGALALGAPAMGWPTALRAGTALPMASMAPTLGRRMAGSALGGAGIGAAAGFANSPNGDPLGTLMGASTGAAIGGVTPLVGELASIPLDAFSRRFLNGTDSQALNRIAGRIAQDERAGGPGANEISQALANAGSKPLSIADVAGENTQALAGKTTRMPGPGREASNTFLGDRLSSMGPRLVGDIDTALPTGSAFNTANDLMEQRATAADPLYQQAYAANQAISSPEISRILDTPIGQQALAAARVKMQNDRSLMGQPVPALTALAQQQGIASPGGVAAGLNLRSLDYVKRAFDDRIGTAIRNGESDDARIFTARKKDLVSAIDDADVTATRDQQGNITAPGLYKQARDAFAGPSAMNEALQAGQTFRSMRPEEIDSAISGYSPSEREFFRLGAADALRREVMRTGDPRAIIGTNAANNRGADLMKQQLRPLFDNQSDFDGFVHDVSNESLILGNTGKLIGNPATAGRLAEDNAGHGGDVLAKALTTGGALLSGEPFVAATQAPGLIRSLARNGLETNNPAVNASIAGKLFSSDPQANAETLAAIIARSRYPSLSSRLAIPAASAAASNPLVPLRAGGALASILSQSPFNAGQAAAQK